jgi:hypothetical protein
MVSVVCLLSSVICLLCFLFLGGCGPSTGYTNGSLFPTDVNSVYLQMFDNRSFRRGIEFTLSDALAKRIEVDTPYKIVSSQDRADSPAPPIPPRHCPPDW